MLRRKMTAIVFALVVTACDTAGPGSQVSAAGETAANGVANSNQPVAASSGGAEPDERMINAVKSRKAVLLVLKDNFVPLALMAKGRIDYNPEAAQTYANRLPVMIGMMEERFTTDTRDSGVETEALDVIWEDMDAFKGKISDALNAANNLAVVASDEAQFEDAVTPLRKSCGSCHDDFRVDND